MANGSATIEIEKEMAERTSELLRIRTEHQDECSALLDDLERGQTKSMTLRRRKIYQIEKTFKSACKKLRGIKKKLEEHEERKAFVKKLQIDVVMEDFHLTKDEAVEWVERINASPKYALMHENANYQRNNK